MQTSYSQQIRAVQNELKKTPIDSWKWQALNDAAGTIYGKSIEESTKSTPDKYTKWYFYIATVLSFFGLIFILETLIKAFLAL